MGAMTLVNSRSNTATIVSSVARKAGGCRTTGSPVPYPPGDGGTPALGEPIWDSDLQAKLSHTGSYQDKNCFYTIHQAWQGCAKQCNWEPKCQAYTVQITKRDKCWNTSCFSHFIYESKYILNKSDSPTPPEWYVSGVCRLN